MLKFIGLFLWLWSACLWADESSCCRYCSERSQVCGDSCIALGSVCHKLSGCACDKSLRPKSEAYQQGYLAGIEATNENILKVLDILANSTTYVHILSDVRLVVDALD